MIEAVFEDLKVKHELFSALDRVCPPQTLFASNTSTISITEIAGGSGRADRFVGMHFCLPAQLMKLVEMSPGLNTSDDTWQRAWAFCEALGQLPVKTQDTLAAKTQDTLVDAVETAEIDEITQAKQDLLNGMYDAFTSNLESKYVDKRVHEEWQKLKMQNQMSGKGLETHDVEMNSNKIAPVVALRAPSPTGTPGPTAAAALSYLSEEVPRLLKDRS